MKKELSPRLCAVLAAVLCLSFALPLAAFSEDIASTVGYTVRAVLPDNNLGDSGYFNLALAPGQQQVITVQVTNLRPSPLRLSMEINGACTNPNGLIVYTQPDGGAQTSQLDGQPTPATFAVDPATIGEGHAILSLQNNIITLAPHASVELPIHIAMPDDPVEGQLLGGIVLTRLDADEGAHEASFSIRSLYSYAIAMQLQNDANTAPAPNLSLQSVKVDTVAGWDALVISLENSAPVVIAGAQLDLILRAQGEDTPLLDIRGQRVSIAPGTILPYTIPLTDGPLQPGQYDVTVTFAHNGMTTSMQDTLTVAEAGM